MPIFAILALAKLKSGFGALFNWLSHRSFWQLVCMAMALVIVVQRFSLADARHDRDACEAARKADRTAYERAQSEAATANKAQVARVEQKQKDISDEVTHDLNTRLERLRRELRQQSAPQGVAGRPGASQGGTAPSGVDGEAGVCLAAPELLRAAENEERHDRLIDWVERQAGIDPNAK